MSAQRSGIVLFDGECNLCSSLVQWLISHDPAARLTFASLQSNSGQHYLRSFGIPLDTDSFVMVSGGAARITSDAALHTGVILGGRFGVLARIGRLIPRPLRNAAYTVVASNRYKWFGKKDQCWIPTPALKARFLHD